MDKQQHGRDLKTAMARQGLNRQAIADLTGVKTRTVTNWTSGTTMPSARELEILETVLGHYAVGGLDPVESAIRRSLLIKWRQDSVISTYERNLYEQTREEVEGA